MGTSQDRLREMRQFVLEMPKQLREGLKLKVDPPPAPFEIRSVLLAGMGGSAIGADLLLEWLRDRISVPAAVHRGGGLPAWAGSDTAVVAISYSGNTRETLEAATEASEEGGQLVAITTGGRLAELGSGRIPTVRVPPGMPPRMAFGYLFAASVCVMDDLGLTDASSEVEDAARELESNIPDLQRRATELGEELADTLTTVYGYPPYVAVAKRWASQLNENAKVMAWWGELPEATHNQVEGWGGKGVDRNLSAVFIRDPAEDGETARLVDEMMAVVSRQAACHTVVTLGRSVLSRMLSGVVVGDLVSLEIAARRGVNPRDVPVIDGIKRAVGGG